MLAAGLQSQHLLGGVLLLLPGHIQLILGLLQVPAGFLRPVGGLAQGGFQSRQLLPQPGQLAGPGQDPGAAADAAAGHGAAPVDDLTVQGDDAEAVLIPTGHTHAAVQVLHHHGAAQQILENAVIPGVIRHQLGGDAHKAVFLVQARLPEHIAPDGAHGQERGASRVPALQEGDGLLGVGVPVHHDVLQSRAQGDLQGHGVLGVGGHKACHGAVNPGQSAPVRRLHHALHRPGEALVVLLHLRQQTDAVLHGGQLPAQLFGLLGGLLGPAAPALHLQAVALDDVGGGLFLLPGIGQGGVVFFGLPAALVQLFPGGGAVGGDGGLTGLGLGPGGVQSGQLRPAPGGVSHGQSLLGPQGLGFLLGASGAFGQLPQGVHQLLQLPGQVLGLRVDLVYAVR